MDRNRIRGIVRHQERTYIPEEYRLLYNKGSIEKMFEGRSDRDKYVFIQMLESLDDIDKKMITLGELQELAEEYMADEMVSLIEKLSKHKREYE